MPASSYQAVASASSAGLPTGDSLRNAFIFCEVLRKNGQSRKWTAGHQFDNNIQPPTDWMKSGAQYTPSYLVNSGLWGSDESNKFSRDVTTLVEHCCGDWNTFKTVYNKEKPATQDALLRAITENIFDTWGASPGWSTSHQEIYKEAIKRLVEYDTTTRKPHGAKSGSNPPTNSTECTTSAPLKSNIHNTLPEREVPNVDDNEIRVEDMAFIVSREANWDGHGMPTDRHTRRIHHFQKRQPQDILRDIKKWLKARPISFNPAEEEIHLLCPNEHYGWVMTTNFRPLQYALADEHLWNAVNLKMKIVPKHTIQTAVPIIDSSDRAATKEEMKMFFANYPFTTCGSGFFECNPPTEATWKETQSFFKLSPSCKSDANMFKVQGIKQPVHLHHLMVLTQAREMLQDIPVMFLTDGAGLDPLKSAWLLVWRSNVTSMMAAEILAERANGDNGHKHLRRDAPTGSTCPSPWPFRCLCETGGNGPFDSPSASLVICKTQNALSEWKEKFYETFDTTCPLTPRLVVLPDTKHAKTSSTYPSQLINFVDAIQPRAIQPRHTVYLEIGRRGLRINDLLQYVKASHPGLQLDAVFLDQRAPVTHQTRAPEDESISVDASNDITRPRESMSSFSQHNADPYKVYILHSLWWEETQELSPYLELVKDQIARQTKYAKTAGLSTVAEDTMNKIEALMEKTRPSKNPRNVCYDKHGRRRYNADIGQLLSKLSIRRFHDTIIAADNGRNSMIKELPSPVIHGDSLTYTDHLLEVCNANFLALREVFEIIKNSDSDEPSNLGPISRQRLMQMLMTCKVMATLPSLTEPIFNGYFDEWRTAERISYRGRTRQTLCLEYDLSKSFIEADSFTQEGPLFRRALEVARGDAKIGWLIKTIKSIIRQPARPNFPTNNFPAPKDTLEKIIIVVQASFVGHVIAGIVKECFGHEGVTLLTSDMHAKNQAKNIQEFQTPTIDDVSSDDEDVIMADDPVSRMPTNNPAPRILVAVQDAVSPAIDLTCANHMIFLEPALFASDEVRIAKQMHAASQVCRCFMYRPVVKGLQVEEMTRSKKERKWFMETLNKVKD